MKIEEYVKKYSAERGKTETVAAFRYRVWKVSLQVGDTKYRKDLTVSACDAMASL